MGITNDVGYLSKYDLLISITNVVQIMICKLIN